MSSGALREAPPAPFLSASFDRFSLVEIFGVLALSRQFYGLSLSEADDEVGTIAIKAGRVIAAEDFRSRAVGTDALKALLDDPGTEFAVGVLPPDAPERRSGAEICVLAEWLPGANGAAPDLPGVPLADGAPLAPPPDPDPAEEAAPLPAPGEPPADEGAALLNGNVSDASFEEILEVLQLSEQPVEIAFSRDGAPIGTLTLRSEQVLAAATGGLGGIEAFRRLHADHGDSFELRRAPEADAAAALGSVTELLAALRQPRQAAPRAEGPPFLRGRMADFPLERLIGSLDLSRQPIELAFRRGEAVLHRVRIKSGFVAAAESLSGERGAAALAAIRADPGDGFLAYRCAAPPEGPPLARLAALIAEAGGERAQAEEPPDPGPAGRGTGSAPSSPPKPDAPPPLAELFARLDRLRRPARGERPAAPAAADADAAPGRRVRGLLWAILGVQLATLAVILGVLALAFG